MASAGEYAAGVMHHLVSHDGNGGHGYTWDARWGDGTWEQIDVLGRSFKVRSGDRDCSSGCISAWEAVVPGCTGGATYTGNMRSCFTATGIWEWHPGTSFIASPGDLYLNEANHVAMCFTQTPDTLLQFSINENGGCYGGRQGDQTGWESNISPYYDYPWDGILHYVGDGLANAGSPAGGGSGGNQAAVSGGVPMPKYRVAVVRNGRKEWLEWCEGLRCEDGCGDDFAGIAGSPIVDVKFADGSLGPDGWYMKTMAGGKLVALTVYYDTPEPDKTGYYAAKYRVHWMGATPAWGKWEYDDNDDYAGNMRDAIDMVQVTLERV
ncbi:MAG: hypothetical protein SPG36_06205 [Eggerthellaceae bacterium]|nr:hypothetical protein [Eggerthellaceae bacterium]